MCGMERLLSTRFPILHFNIPTAAFRVYLFMENENLQPDLILLTR